MIPKIIDRIKQLQEESKVVTVFSAPLIEYNGKVSSMTDVAIDVGRSYAASNPVEIEVLRHQDAARHAALWTHRWRGRLENMTAAFAAFEPHELPPLVRGVRLHEHVQPEAEVVNTQTLKPHLDDRS